MLLSGGGWSGSVLRFFWRFAFLYILVFLSVGIGILIFKMIVLVSVVCCVSYIYYTALVCYRVPSIL